MFTVVVHSLLVSAAVAANNVKKTKTRHHPTGSYTQSHPYIVSCDFYAITTLRFMRIFAEIPQGGASNDSGVVDSGNFQRFRWLFLGYFRDKASVSFISRKVLFSRRFGLDRATLENNNCVKTNKDRHILSVSAVQMFVRDLVSDNIRLVRIFGRIL